MRRTAALTTALFALCVPTLAQAQADPAPWWQVLSGSRPSNLWRPPDESEVQKLSAAPIKPAFSSDEILIARLEVGGELLGCLGSGEYQGQSPDQLCEAHTEFAAIETAAEMQTALEGRYGAGEVEVTGGPAGAGDFLIATPGGWVAPVAASPVTVLHIGTPTELGKTSTEVLSEGSGRLVITATNLGNAPFDGTETPLEIVDELPEGAAAYGFEAFAGAQGAAGPVNCQLPTTKLLNCSFEGVLSPYEAIEVEVLIALQGDPPAAGDPGTITITGASKPFAQPIEVSDAAVPFGLESFDAGAEEPPFGEPTSQAGAHPFQVTNTVAFRSGAVIGGPDRRNATVEQPALPRDTRVTFPAGLAGSAVAVDRCDLADFITSTDGTGSVGFNLCPDASAVGVASVTIVEPANFGLVRLAVPVFNLTPAHGSPARFGFMPFGVPVLIEASVDPGEEYRITGEVANAPQAAQVLAATVTLWGTPGAVAHDSSRGWGCVLYTASPEDCKAPQVRDATPFLRMPTRCGAPLGFAAELEPWNVPAGGLLSRASAQADPLTGCNRVPFDPAISSTLTTKLAESPTGLEFELRLPGTGFSDPEAEASEAQPKRVEVTLPAGVTINPSQAEGLATCSEAQLARERYDSRPGEGCPEASKIGSIEGTTPLISETLRGSLYVAEPYANPFDSLIALYVVARVPERGVLVKQAGVVEPDPRTGQLVSTFDDLPQLPYDNFKLRFREGARAPLVSPPSCGTHRTTARFVPWSASDPDHPRADEITERGDSFEIERGAEGGACPPGGVPPFAPGFSAGSLNNQAGSYSPFVMRLTRQDGMQDMTRFGLKLPPGMVGSLAGVPYCPERGIARARSRSGQNGGHEELADPSCPAASRIGRSLAGAGVGQVLTYVPGSLYLAGPYMGAPLSVVAITPALAGPFDAGTVVVRVGLTLNPVSAEVEVDGSASEPIPHILKGIPLKLRDLRVYADRPHFTLNPTSCAKLATTASVFGSGADVLDPADDVPHALAFPFQAAGCGALGFKPKLGLKLKGATRRGGFPALRAHYRPRGADANLKRLALTFPSSAFVEQGHFRTICTRVRFAAAPGHGSECPKGSIYGHARVWTPLLDEPLEGPVYLRSSDNNLPDAVFALHGLVDIEVAVRIDSVNGRLRATVQSAPDAPVSRAIVDMRGGRKGLFVNSRNLCHKAKQNRARANLRAHNGRARTLRPVVRALGCKKQRKRQRRGAERRG